MNDVNKLKNGLYEIHWASGAYSLAAVGRNSLGYVWMAPTNWVKITHDNSHHWQEVTKAVLIRQEIHPQVLTEIGSGE